MKKNAYNIIVLLSLFVIQETYVSYFIDLNVSSRFLMLNIFTFILLYSVRELALTAIYSRLSLIIFGFFIPMFLYIPYLCAGMPKPMLFSLLILKSFLSLAFLFTVIIPLLYFFFICYAEIKYYK